MVGFLAIASEVAPRAPKDIPPALERFPRASCDKADQTHRQLASIGRCWGVGIFSFVAHWYQRFAGVGFGSNILDGVNGGTAEDVQLHVEVC